MGVLSDLIIADRSEAASINAAQGAHLDQWICLESKGIDSIKLSTLWGILSNTEFDPSFMGGGAILDQASDDGPWVMLAPPELVAAVADLDDARVRKVANAWAKTEEFTLDRWPAELVHEYLAAFRQFARQARQESKDVLLWVSL